MQSVGRASHDFRCYEDLVNLNRSEEVFIKIQNHQSVSCMLQKPGSTAGRVLSHASSVFEKLHQRYRPMTFKFGITHDPVMRWDNLKYGYRHALEKFEHMVVIFAAGNPHAPAFLEAALIDKFWSAMASSTWHLLIVCWSCFVENVGVVELISRDHYIP